MSREDEIRQGLREPSGMLIGGLNVLDYSQGADDFKQGTPPPQMSSASYDLGRMRAQEKREEATAVDDWIKTENARREAVMQDVLKDRPDLLAEYKAKIASIRERTPEALPPLPGDGI